MTTQEDILRNQNEKLARENEALKRSLLATQNASTIHYYNQSITADADAEIIVLKQRIEKLTATIANLQTDCMYSHWKIEQIQKELESANEKLLDSYVNNLNKTNSSKE